MNSAKLVVGVTGMAGAGKSLIVKTSQEKGYGVVVMGDEVREETRKRGLTLTPENMGKVMLDLRRLEGDAVMAKRCILKIEGAREPKIVIDGIRSLDEVDEFKRHFANFRLLAIHASPEKRFQRLFNRRRSDDPKDRQVFRDRDMRELGVGLGNAIAMADHVIVNEGRKEETREKTLQVLGRVEEQWKI